MNDLEPSLHDIEMPLNDLKPSLHDLKMPLNEVKLTLRHVQPLLHELQMPLHKSQGALFVDNVLSIYFIGSSSPYYGLFVF